MKDARVTESPPTNTGAGQWPVRVYYEDTDSGGVVYHTGYLRFMERARTEWLRALGYDQRALTAELDLLFVVRQLSVTYHRPAVLDDELLVESTVWPQGRTRLIFEQAVRRVGTDPLTCCEGRVEVVCMDARTRRPRGIPDRLQAELTDGR